MMSTVMKTDKVNDLYNKYANKQKEEVKSETKPAEVEPKAKEETKQEVVKEDKVETGKTDADKIVNPDTTKEEVETKPVETETKVEKKPTYSKQEKIDFAFQKKQAKIKKLEQRNKELEEELKKYKGLTLEDFKGNHQDYLDYKVDMLDKQREVKQIQDEIKTTQTQEFNESNKRKIQNCFPDEATQSKYSDLIANKGVDLVKTLDEYDKEQAILGYLDDSELSPLLITLLITEPSYLNEVLSKNSPYGKYRAMEKLEEKVQFARNKMAEQNSKPAEKVEEKQKPAIPVIGSVTKSESTKDTKKVFDANQILHDLKNKNKYHK